MKIDIIKEEELLTQVYLWVNHNPAMLAKIINAGVAGIQEKLKTEQQQALDMEVLAATAMQMAISKNRVTQKTKEYFEELAKDKLARYQDKTKLNWSWVITGKDEWVIS